MAHARSSLHSVKVVTIFMFLTAQKSNIYKVPGDKVKVLEDSLLLTG